MHSSNLQPSLPTRIPASELPESGGSTAVSSLVTGSVVSLLSPAEPAGEPFDIRGEVVGRVKNLAPLPQTILDIYALKRSNPPDIDRLLKVIHDDTVIKANLVRISNSVAYGPARKIRTDEDILQVLGYRMIINVAMCTSINGHLRTDLSPYGITQEELTANSNRQSEIIGFWSDPSLSSIREDLQFAASLQDLGIVVISKTALEKGLAPAFRESMESIGDRALAEEAVFGLSSSAVTGLIFEEWKFSEDLIEFIRAADFPERASEEASLGAKALKIAKTLAPAGMPEFSSEAVEKARHLVCEYGFEERAFERMLERMSQD